MGRQLPLARREVGLLIAVTALGALARFAAIRTQSFWYDESITVELVRASGRDMLEGVRAHEATPPLYFVLAWIWAHAFGSDELGLRSLSSVAGTLTVPVAYLVGRHVAGPRAALAASGLTALSPALIWYSQEARSYAVFVLLAALSLLFFARALDGGARDLAAWAVTSALAVATHYFALFLVAAEAAWLLYRLSARRRTAIAVGAVGLVGVALLPMMLYQRVHGGTGWIAGSPLGERIGNAAYFLAVGPGFEDRTAEMGVGPLSATQIAVAVLAVVLVALAAAAPAPRSRALLLAGLAAAVVAVPLLVDLLGQEVFLDRNLLPVWVPLAAVAGAAAVAARRGRMALAVVALAAAAFVVVDVRVPGDEGLHRDDWRGIARAMGPASETRIVALTPGWHVKPFSFYSPNVQPLLTGQRVSEVTTITYDGYVPGTPGGVRAPVPGPPFREASRQTVQRFTLVRYTADRPVTVTSEALAGQAGVNGTLAFVQPG